MAIFDSLNPPNSVIWVGSLQQKGTKTIIEVEDSNFFSLRMELYHEVAPEEQQQNAKIQPLWVPTTPAKPAPAPIPCDLGNGQEYRVSTNPICPETKLMTTRTSGGLSQESATQDVLSTDGHKSRPRTLTYNPAEEGWRPTPGTKPMELNGMEAVRSNPFLKLLLQSQIGDDQSISVRPNQILPPNPILSTGISHSTP